MKDFIPLDSKVKTMTVLSRIFWLGRCLFLSSDNFFFFCGYVWTSDTSSWFLFAICSRS